VQNLFPARQVLPGCRRITRRDEDEFCRYDPSAIGQFQTLSAANFLGNVPIGRFVRELLYQTFNFLTVDCLAYSPQDVCFFLISVVYILIAVFILYAGSLRVA